MSPAKYIFSFLLLPGFLLAAAPAFAKKNVTTFELRFVPQQSVGTVGFSLDPSMHGRAVALRVEDGREPEGRSVVGTRTDDDDRLFELSATTEVRSFVEKTLKGQLKQLGVPTSDGADIVLAVTLLTFDVTETNQAVGATYQSDVTLSFILKDRAGNTLWTGSSNGDATRYGRKFSNRNCNEVLSDALLEAWANLLSDARLHRAWAGEGTPTPPPTAAGDVRASRTVQANAVSPSELLQEVKELLDGEFEVETIVNYVQQKSLTAKFDSRDLVEWKQAGVPEEVLRTAMSRPSE